MGTLGTMHTDVVLISLLVWIVEVSGQLRTRGQILQPLRLYRLVLHHEKCALLALCVITRED